VWLGGAKGEEPTNMMGYLRHKFALEIFIGIQGFPRDLDWFPSEAKIEAWKVCYLMEGSDLDYFYWELWKNHSKTWKQIRDKPFHIPEGEDLISFNRVLRKEETVTK